MMVTGFVVSSQRCKMNRNILFKWYDTPRGRILQQSETAFLKHSLTVGCKQTIVQVGVLGWEKEFIDCSLYQHFLVIDNTARDCQAAHRIQAEPDQLPVLSNSADMVILPHLLEFSDNQHQILREVERILKPEGKLIILNFNPWSFWVWHQYFWDQKKPDSLRGNFISRTKIVDWLKLLNFEVEIAAGFRSDVLSTGVSRSERNKHSVRVVAYAIKAIKRCYHIIPFTPVSVLRPRLAIVGAMESAVSRDCHSLNVAASGRSSRRTA